MPTTTLPTQLAVSKAEAARLLGMSPHTIDQLIIRGRLRAKRVTRRGTYHISVQSIHEFLGDK
ncbi:MAG: helix-turn-helix domain-containing protein [Scardovia wiggsiae]|uniref:helix-turn-helix domain-containing protein n=1 Tax=Scardovia wiggsiae TaxID=230143 RepID=UPI00360CD889